VIDCSRCSKASGVKGREMLIEYNDRSVLGLVCSTMQARCEVSISMTSKSNAVESTNGEI